MLLIFRALFDPITNKSDLRGCQLFAGFRGRQPFFRVIRRQPRHHQALLRRPRDNRAAVLQFRPAPPLGIETQFRLPLVLVRAMALETVIRKYRPYVPIELDGVLCCRTAARQQNNKDWGEAAIRDLDILVDRIPGRRF